MKIEGTYDGKDMSGTYNAGSVWKQKKGTMDGDLPHQHKTGGRGAVAGKSREQGVIVEEALAAQAPLEDSAFGTNAATIRPWH